jgi:uncharacterized membrane protein
MAEEMINEPVDSGDITSDDKLWALLSWIVWPLAVVVLLMEDKKNRPFLKYNAVLALVFGIIVQGIVGSITIGCIFILAEIYMIYLGFKAYQGEWVEVPFFSDFVKNQGWT